MQVAHSPCLPSHDRHHALGDHLTTRYSSSNGLGTSSTQRSAWLSSRKAFHQPLADFSDDAQLSATIERELEEELLGRPELELAGGGQGWHVDPMHLSRLSEPMRWLIERARTDTWRIDGTGFGINLIGGNYEFATLVVVEDEAWWTQFGGDIVTNWEAGGVRCYSSLDRDGIATLLNDETWSNEGLFAFLQGLRRLDQTGGSRVDLPTIKWEQHG